MYKEDDDLDFCCRFNFAADDLGKLSASTNRVEPLS